MRGLPSVRVVNVRLPPAGFEVGDVLQLVADTGELVEVPVPPGAGPGSVLQVEIPDESAAVIGNVGNVGNVYGNERWTGGSLQIPSERRSLRRAATASEHIVGAVSGHSDLSDEEWYWLKVIIVCTIWLVFLCTVLIFGGRATRKVKP